MSISAKGHVCGLLAYPVGHSLSPDMHNYFSEKLGIDEVYIPLETAPEDLGAAIKGAWAMGFLGMNVTIPHKQAVIKELSEIDISAKLVGAVNTLVRTQKGYKGYNTDLYGLTKSIKERGLKLSGCEAILIGAGGAAAAAAAMLLNEGAKHIYIINRTAKRARGLSDRVNELSGRELAKSLSYDELSLIKGYKSSEGNKRYIIIQSTNIGMSPHTDEAPILDAAFYAMAHTAVEIIFNPRSTLFMKLSEEAGATTIGGLKMLLYQGVKAYELWNNVKLSDEIIDGAYRMMKERLR